ncbi:MAG: epoxyqueuosine reductase QueH [Lachnospiraceae bacterium]|nr:epoxyqueuosine reductase QueH [Lachnospiraceae bacterium]
MNKRNYQRELDEITGKIEKDLAKGGKKPSLLLHSCCAPCSSYCLLYLLKYFDITDLYYNPNITDEDEYRHRRDELKRLTDEYNREFLGEDALKIMFIEGDHEPELFLEMAKGLEKEKEGGKRCYKCYELRLRKAAEYAKNGGFDYFTTTLSISPLKNADWINEIGERVGEEYGVKHLPSDFKKKDGYLTSIRLSKEYGLYRQDYCGCEFSKQNRRSGDPEPEA